MDQHITRRMWACYGLTRWERLQICPYYNDAMTAFTLSLCPLMSFFCCFWIYLLAVLSPVHTVAEKWDCRRKRRDNGKIRRLSHFSATVWTGFYVFRVFSRSYCMQSVRLLASMSVCLSVMLCIVAKRYILQQQCLNKWIGSALLGAWFYNFQPYTDPEPSNSPPPKFPNFFNITTTCG